MEQKARELVSDYERFGQGCSYDCAPNKAVCTVGRCELLIAF